jgi:hypothetical protein
MVAHFLLQGNEAYLINNARSKKHNAKAGIALICPFTGLSFVKQNSGYLSFYCCYFNTSASLL